jgi:hypothetical protein
MGDGAPGNREPGFGASLRTFSLRVLVGTALAVIVAAIALRWWGGRNENAPTSPPPAANARAPVVSPPAGERTGERRQHPPEPLSSTARDIERRHAAGVLSEAQKRFERCPGGDVRKVAWIDASAGVVKLVRERGDGVVLEEWFDDEGRLREAVWQGRTGSGAWGRRITIDPDGREMAEELDAGAVPDAPPPRLDRRDPTAAFFAGPGCGR